MPKRLDARRHAFGIRSEIRVLAGERIAVAVSAAVAPRRVVYPVGLLFDENFPAF